MTTLREAAQQALEALKLSTPDDYAEQGWKEHNATITALRSALAEPVQGCPSCEYNKARAQLWRHEAYKVGGHPLDWEPELMVRPKPLTEEEIDELSRTMVKGDRSVNWLCRAIERAHGIGEKNEQV